jgi:hypothetical protein
MNKHEQKYAINDFTMLVTPSVNVPLMAILNMKNVRFKFIDPTLVHEWDICNI